MDRCTYVRKLFFAHPFFSILILVDYSRVSKPYIVTPKIIKRSFRTTVNVILHIGSREGGTFARPVESLPS